MKPESGTISKGFKWAWSSRAVSLGVHVLFIGYLTFYCTDVLNMNPGLVGGILLASKIFDGITDILAGFLIDRTHTRLGQARPYQFFILPCWVLTILLFAVPDIGITAQTIYIFILYTLINAVCATFLNGSDAIFLARTVKNEKERVSVTSFAGALTLVCCIIVSIIMPQVLERIGISHKSWMIMAIAFGVPLGILGTMRFVFCKEFEPSTAQKQDMEKISVIESLKLLFKNKYIMLLTLILFFFYIQNNIYITVQTYYFKYIVGNIGLASVAGAANLIVPIIIIFTPALSRKFGTVKCLRIAMLIGVIGYAVRTIGGINIITLLLGTVLSMISTVPITALINVYIVDCMDYGAWKNGKRVDGLISSITAFGKKMGGSLASAVVGIMMGIAGYNGALSVQSDAANMSIIVLFNYIPLFATIVMFILSILYDIDKHMPQIKKDL